MWLVSTVLQVPQLESNIRSLADVLYHDETRVSSGESVHRRGLEGEGGIPSSRMSTGRTFKSTSARAWEKKDMTEETLGYRADGT